jgi:hypothetical protein
LAVQWTGLAGWGPKAIRGVRNARLSPGIRRTVRAVARGRVSGGSLSRGIAGASVLRRFSVCRCVVRISDLSRIQAVNKRQVVDGGGGRARFSADNHDRLADRGHAVSGSRRGRWAHVLESVPSAGADPKRRQIAEVCSILHAASENVHDIVNYGRGVAFSRRRNVADTIQLRPQVRHGVITPHVIKPLEPVCTTEPRQS